MSSCQQHRVFSPWTERRRLKKKKLILTQRIPFTSEAFRRRNLVERVLRIFFERQFFSWMHQSFLHLLGSISIVFVLLSVLGILRGWNKDSFTRSPSELDWLIIFWFFKPLDLCFLIFNDVKIEFSETTCYAIMQLSYLARLLKRS